MAAARASEEPRKKFHEDRVKERSIPAGAEVPENDHKDDVDDDDLTRDVAKCLDRVDQCIQDFIVRGVHPQDGELRAKCQELIDAIIDARRRHDEAPREPPPPRKRPVRKRITSKQPEQGEDDDTDVRVQRAEWCERMHPRCIGEAGRARYVRNRRRGSKIGARDKHVTLFYANVNRRSAKAEEYVLGRSDDIVMAGETHIAQDGLHRSMRAFEKAHCEVSFARAARSPKSDDGTWGGTMVAVRSHIGSAPAAGDSCQGSFAVTSGSDIAARYVEIQGGRILVASGYARNGCYRPLLVKIATWSDFGRTPFILLADFNAQPEVVANDELVRKPQSGGESTGWGWSIVPSGHGHVDWLRGAIGSHRQFRVRSGRAVRTARRHGDANPQEPACSPHDQAGVGSGLSRTVCAHSEMQFAPIGVGKGMARHGG